MPIARKSYAKKKIDGTTFNAHRLIWAEAHGPIPDDCIIHHRNGDRRDNRLENLELMTHRQHSVHHNAKHPLTKECAVCGGTFTPHPTKRARAVTCSRACFKVRISQSNAERYAPLEERDERIRALASQGVKKRDIAKAFGLSPATITRITKA